MDSPVRFDPLYTDDGGPMDGWNSPASCRTDELSDIWVQLKNELAHVGYDMSRYQFSDFLKFVGEPPRHGIQ